MNHKTLYDLLEQKSKSTCGLPFRGEIYYGSPNIFRYSRGRSVRTDNLGAACPPEAGSVDVHDLSSRAMARQLPPNLRRLGRRWRAWHRDRPVAILGRAANF